MKTPHSFVTFALALVFTSVACGEKASNAKDLVGTWYAKSVTVKRDAQEDEETVYKANELETQFLADGTFVTIDRSQPDSITISGKYEVLNDHQLKQTVLEVKGSKYSSDALKGRVVPMDYNVASDKLVLVVNFVDKSGIVIGATESAFVRASR
jgi:hypothetical protein